MSNPEVPYGTIEDGKIILNPWKDHSARDIGEIREEGPEFAIKYFTERFEELEGKVRDLEKTIEETENKGSYLQKVLHLRGGLAEYDGLGDFENLDLRLAKLQQELEELVAKNRIRNTEVKRTLITELEEAVVLISWEEATDQVQDIKGRWIKVGNAVKEQQEALNDEFWGKVQEFFDRKRAFYEDKRRLQKQNEDAYWTLIKEANTVSRLSGDRKHEKIAELKERWQEVGNVPSRVYKPLLSKFQANLRRTSRPAFVDPKRQLEQIQAELIAIQQGNVVFDQRKADYIRKSLFNIRSRDPKIETQKNDLLNQLQLLSEIEFVERLCSKRFSDYDSLDEVEQNRLQVQVLQELIKKEEEDLSQFQLNMERFNANDPGAERMMNRRLSQQKNRIQVKKRLVTILGG